ncbi:GGDEF domain-containing protein [Smaragdicoccus niigatensis]|uniref:GGDEF domain-containing protein n=1 Tax=Smaragdicoccus niigatensis TaxID=359359 RepID=UPI0004781CD7|nr:GGDEF domain-containing protein [Smaragdicoccus niigatensis]
MNDSSGAVTIALLAPAVLSVFGLFFCWAWFLDRQRTYLRLIGIAPFVFSIGVLIRIFDEPANPALNAVLSDTAIIGSVLLLAQGILKRSQLAFPMRFCVGVLAVVTGGCGALVYFDPQTAAEIYLRSASCGFVLLVAACRLWLLRTHRSVDTVLNWVLTIFALQFVPRTAIMVELAKSGEDPYSVGTLLWVVMHLVMALLGAALTGAIWAAYLGDVVAGLRRERDADMLTGVLNRGGFEALAAQELRAFSSRGHVMIVCDIDHFKAVNDKFGHAAGDAVLRRFGVLLNASVRLGDVVGRVGGEEFAILARDVDLAGGFALAERLRTALIEESLDDIAPQARVTASFGVAAVAAGASVASVLGEADRQLYLAKRAGRNRTFADQLSMM